MNPSLSATAASSSHWRDRLIRPWLARLLRRFERRYGYDAGFQHALLALDTGAFVRFQRAVRRLDSAEARLPPALRYAARFAAARHDDCGACARLMLAMAEEAGVPRTVLQALVDEQPDAMGPEAALGWHFARAVLARSDITPWRERVLAAHGPEALAALALAIVSERTYPTLRYAVDPHPACEPLRFP